MNGNSLLIVLVFLGAGYVLHPLVIDGLVDSGLVSAPPEEVQQKEDADVALPTKDVAKPSPVVVDLSGVTAEDFPETVKLQESVTVQLPGVDASVNLPIGADVKPIAMEGSILVFAPKGIDTKGRVDMDKTDFKQKIKLILDEKAKLSVEKKDVEVDVPRSDPEPKPAPQLVDEPQMLSQDVAVELMKNSVKSGAMKEFTYDQVLAWKLDGKEEVDGEEYQVGLIVCGAETFFGPQKLQVKALIKDGKLVKWVWAKTGVEVP